MECTIRVYGPGVSPARLKSPENDELVLVLSDPDCAYTHSEICDLLDQAEKLGFDFDGPELQTIHTARQL